MSEIKSISGTSPAAASTAIIGTLYGLSAHRGFRIEALLVGATGGALDVYLQRKIGPNLWSEWCHFAQLAAGASAVRYALQAEHGNSTTIVTSAAGGTDDTPALTGNAGTFLGGHPGDAIRCVCVAGASTSAGAAVTILVTPIGD